MIFDCFQFYNELDLLEIRLHELSDVVDMFVLVEATRTHSGLPKLLYFADNRKRFAGFNERIIHVVVDDMPDSGDAWTRENHQRNAILRGLKDSALDDLILISDVDEIPRAEMLLEIREGLNVFSQTFYYYYLNVVCEKEPIWYGTRALKRSEMTSPQEVRASFGHVITDGGWHFSYLGGSEAIRSKLQSFAHQEYNTSIYTDLDYIHKCIEEGRDFLGRDIQWKIVEINETFPKQVVNNLNLYKHLIVNPKTAQGVRKNNNKIPIENYFQVIFDAQKQLNSLRLENISNKQSVQALTAQMEEISGSKAWKLALVLRRIWYWFLPSHSIRKRLIRFLFNGLKSIVSGINRSHYFIRNILSSYSNYGAKITFYEIQKRMGPKVKKVPPYQLLQNKFPQKFVVAQNPLRNAMQRNRIVDSFAQIALQKAMKQLKIPGDANAVLSAFKVSFGKNKYYRILMDIFTFEQFMKVPSEGTVYPLIQVSELPKVSGDSRRRRILFITSQFPNPYHGGGSRVLNFIKILSKNNDIYLSTCFDPEEDESVTQLVDPYCQAIQQIPSWRFGSNQAEIRDRFKGIPMDIVHYEWPRSLENYDPDFGKRQIFTYMEAVSLRLLMDMEQAVPLSLAWLEKFAELTHALRVELVDASFLNTRISVTTKDANLFRNLYPYQEYTVLNHGVNFEEFSLPDVEPEPHSLVFVGNYMHYPNVDAVLFFFNNIWDYIKKEVPDVRIFLVGTHAPKQLTRLADGQRIIVTGSVPDVRPYIQKASICIAPLITGAGLRGKVIEYAALHRTFVATSIATTDLVFKDGIDYLCADTAIDFSRRVVALLKDTETRKKMASSAFETARQNYDTRRLGVFLYRLYDRIEKG